MRIARCRMDSHPVAHSSLRLAPSAPVPMAPFPEESWLLGSAKAAAADGLAYYRRCEETAGIVETRMLWKRVYVVTEPSAIADVLVNSPRSFIKPYFLRRMKVFFGNGLLTAEGDEWLHNRRTLQPAFQSDRLPGFIDFTRHNTEAIASVWSTAGVRDVYPDIIDLCLQNVTQTMFGVFDAELRDLTRALVLSCQALVHALTNMLRVSPLLYPNRLTRDLAKAKREFNAYLDRLIAQRNAEPPRNDFLGLLLSGGGHHAPMSRQAIFDESVTMLFAGHETAAAAAAWSLYLLATHPDVADALAADLSAELHGAPPNVAHLDGLPRLRAVIDEAMRLYPPAHRYGRTVIEPVMVGGHLLPKGADVVLSQWAVHRSPRWYDQPDTFLPGRWTPEFRHSLPKFAYFPFGGGPRACVGSHFFWFEAAVILGVLAQRFRYSLVDTKPLVPYEGLTLIPDGGSLRLRIEPRPVPAAG